ncbi:hypothetical protein KY334_00145, partial [Candidatus Woesearchaeota archaeon]|nr:hypothetical protein [Candidatus Woesearchaeota archaeon]
YHVVQPFEYSHRLRENELEPNGQPETGFAEGQTIHSFAKGTCYELKINCIYDGHPGFAWAFRKDSFPGFYDKMIAGGADAFMAYAFFGKHFQPHLYKNEFLKSKEKYIEKVHKIINGKIGFIPGMILHLWHGERKNRHHESRQHILKNLNYNSETDLKLNEYGCWEVNKELDEKISNYFDSRKEE